MPVYTTVIKLGLLQVSPHKFDSTCQHPAEIVTWMKWQRWAGPEPPAARAPQTPPHVSALERGHGELLRVLAPWTQSFVSGKGSRIDLAFISDRDVRVISHLWITHLCKKKFILGQHQLSRRWLVWWRFSFDKPLAFLIFWKKYFLIWSDFTF